MSVEHDSLLLPAGAAEHVLIQLYSPHSDPCRRLVPHFEALAKRLVRIVLTHIVVVGTTIIMNVCVRQAEHSDPVVRAVVVAAIDVDSNDTPAPYDNRGLPTVYLSSRGARGSPKQMEARTQRSRTAAPLFSDGRGGMGFARRLRAARTRWWSSWLGLWRRRQPQPPRVNSESL